MTPCPQCNEPFEHGGLADLEAQREELKYRYIIAENGNDFAETLGLLRDLRKQLWHVEDQIERLEEEEKNHDAG